MSEKIIAFNLDDWHSGYSYDRDEFYKEQIEVFQKTGKPTRAVGIVDLVIFNPHGEILLQERSHSKSYNPGLLDKMGGHIQFGDSPERTLLLETVQELQMPSFFSKKEDFFEDLEILKPYIDTVCYCTLFGTRTKVFPKIIEGKMVDIAQKKYIFMGVYNGPTKLVDREACGVSYYSLERLEKEVAATPDKFTYDIKYLLKTYKKDFENFIAILNGHL